MKLYALIPLALSWYGGLALMVIADTPIDFIEGLCLVLMCVCIGQIHDIVVRQR